MRPAEALNADDFVDNARFGPVHLRVLAIATLMMMIDGYDLYVVGWILPSLSDDFGVPRTDLTSVLIIQQVGMLLGSYFIAPLADRIGRRGLLLVATLAVSITCFGTITAQDVTQFTIWRVLTGMFAGAIVPNLISMSSEMAPKKFRGMMPTIVLCGAMAGALIGAAIQGFILEDYGWHGAFWIGALLPLVMVPVIYFLLPETLNFMVRRNPDDPNISKLARKISPDLPEDARFYEPVPESGTGKAGLSDILVGKRLIRSLMLWGAFICSFMYISLYASWSTTIYRDQIGLDWGQVAMATTVHTTFGMIGTIGIGLLIDRLSFKRVVPLFMIGGALSTLFIGLSGAGMFLLMAIAAKSLFQVGGQAGLASFAPTLYPPRVKGTGVGWAYGAGRIGAMSAPAIGALLISADLSTEAIFSIMGIPLAISGILVFLAANMFSEPTPAGLDSVSAEKAA